MQRKAMLAGIAAMVLAIALPHAAKAQRLDQYLYPDVPGFDVQPGVTVLSRLRPDYAYPGVRLGGFMFYPEVDESLGYDSNVTGTPQAHGSAVAETQGSAKIVSNWGRNSLGATVTVDNYRYLDLPSQSYTNWSASAGGTYDIGRDTLYLGYSHLNLNQTPRQLDVPQLNSPIAYRIDDVHGDYKIVFSRLSVQPGVEVANYNYDNGTVQGVPYIQNFRNRVVVTPSVVLSYEMAPLRSLVLVVSDSEARYTNQTAGAATLNFNDASVLAGVNYDSGGLIRLRALVGYETRHFESSQFATISAPIIEASAVWTPTGLTTVTASAARYIEDSASDTTSGYTETALKLSVDHELWRNVLLNGNGAFYLDNYAANQGSQTYYTVGTAVTWLMNSHMRLVASYQYASRQSSSTAIFNPSLGNDQILAGGYSENTFLLQLKIGL